ncbi:MAG: two pore domain potassium channel family protein [Solirubrobacterales bacterium]|nr:MAG: two pore domain potassium channel family protein [Solirubrobacterales bacterium]
MTWFRMLRTMVRGVKEDPEFRALAGAVGSLLVVGTVFYALNQDWSLVDSFYFSVTTLTTVGFGDLAPEGDGAKLATVAYELSGVGLLVLFLSQLSQRGVREREEKRGRRSESA